MRVALPHASSVTAVLLVLWVVPLASCAGVSQKSEWDNLDYSSVYKKAAERGEYDTGYTPSFSSCVDDDLIGCE